MKLKLLKKNLTWHQLKGFDMKDIIERLKIKQNQIQEKQRIEERRRGQVDQIKKTVESEFQVTDIPSAQEKLAQINTDITADAATLENLEKEMDDILAKASGEEVIVNVGTIQTQ